MKALLGGNSPEEKRGAYLRIWIIATVVVPIILDYVFLGSSAARYSRILIFGMISASLLTNTRLFLSKKLIGFDTSFLALLLYLIGTIAGLAKGGVITPNFVSLWLLMIVVGLNFDLYAVVFKSLEISCYILINISAITIFLRLNPRNFYSSSDGYPVFFNFIGIPGRNYGIFSHPNTLGQAAALAVLFAISSRKNLLYLIAPLICILKCGSRTSIICIITGVLVFIIISLTKGRLKPKFRQLETTFVVGTFLMGIFLASSFQFLNFIKFLDPGSLTGRVSIWQTSLTLFSSSSLFGLGWGWEQRAIDSQLLNVWAVSTHNALLEIIFSSGIVGLSVFLLIITKVIVNFSKLWPVEKIMLTAISISGVSESYVDLQYPTIQTFLIFFIILGANKERPLQNA